MNEWCLLACTTRVLYGMEGVVICKSAVPQVRLNRDPFGLIIRTILIVGFGRVAAEERAFGTPGAQL